MNVAQTALYPRPSSATAASTDKLRASAPMLTDQSLIRSQILPPKTSHQRSDWQARRIADCRTHKLSLNVFGRWLRIRDWSQKTQPSSGILSFGGVWPIALFDYDPAS